MRRTKRFANFALAACMGVSLLVNVPAGTVSAAEPTAEVVAEGATESETVETSSEDATATDAGSGVAEETSLEQAEEVVATGAETSEADFEWNGTRITKYIGTSTEVVIPGRCTEIGENAFQSNWTIETVVIPKSVTKIGKRAFADSRLLKNIVIPDSVKEIGEGAFAITSLKSVKIPEGVTTIEDGLFSSCFALTSVTIPDSVVTIGDEAFYQCVLLENIVIPDGVTAIGKSTFKACSGLKSIKVADGNTIYDSREGCNAIIEKATNTLIYGCKNTIIPNSVTKIGDGAFRECTKLTSITIPDTVKEIAYDAFWYCYDLKIIRGYTGSCAETYAKEYGYTFVDVQGKITTSYRTHVQSFGWQASVTNGKMSGTSGKAKRLEGIEISVSGNANLGIQYSTHCQTYGWLPWSANGEMNGTTGEAKRLEAIKIRLTGKDRDKYDVYYRVHAQSYGWLGWAKNGAPSGTAGYAKRLEGIQIVVVKKGAQAPGLDYAGVNASKGVKDARAYVAKTNGAITIPGSADNVNIMYKTHVQSFGWQNWVLNGAMSGTSGKAKRLEGIDIKLSNAPYAGGIQYKTHIQSFGWEKQWKKDGEMSGTSGKAKRLEAIQIQLYGEMAKHYDVYYRVHAQSYGWLNWAKNGEEAGTAGLAKRLEGIQIVLVPKGSAAPSANYGNIKSVNTKAYIKK